MYDRASMGSPFRMLDTRVSTVKADKTYTVLSGLADLVGGAFQIQHEARSKDMARQAKNDLVNNTINPDLQRHERVYAETVAKGQALDTFQDMKSRVNSGEFDRMSPEKFQEEMNRLHASKANEYSTSKYSKYAVEKWNDFWVNQESTLTAGQAGKYRTALASTQERNLGMSLAKMIENGNYSPQDLIDEVYSEDHSMLNIDQRMDTALSAAAIRAESGDDSLLKLYNAEFGYERDPARYKMYDTAMKVAHRVQHSNATSDAIQMRKEGYLDKVAKGTLTIDDWNKEVRPGVTLGEAVDPEGNQVVTWKEFARGLEQSTVNFVKARDRDRAKELIVKGRDTIGATTRETTNEVFTEVATEAIQNSENPLQTFAELGSIASAQSHSIDFFKNVGTTFADAPLVDGNDANTSTAQNYQVMAALQQGYSNDSKFFRAIGPDAAARFQMIQDEAKYIQGSTEDQIKEALKRVSYIQDRQAKGLIRQIDNIPQDTKDEITKSVKKALGENNKLFRIDTVREGSTQTNDFEFLVNERYKARRNNYGMSHESALKLAVEDVKGNSIEFDGSMVFTGGAEFNFGADPEYTVKTLQNNPEIAKAIAEIHSAGWKTDMPTTPQLDDGLTDLGEPYKTPDWDEVRMVPDPVTNSIMFLDSTNEVIYRIPVEYARTLNEARKQYISPISKGVKDLYSKVWITQEEYDKQQEEANLGPVKDLGDGITVRDIKE